MNREISYEDFIQISKEEEIVSIPDASLVVGTLLREENYEDDYEFSVHKRLREVAKTIENETLQYEGTADDFHNLAVEYARIGMYDCACKILNRGIKDMETSVDLLADYIKYGLSCGRQKECSQYYIKLKNIHISQWNWRAFSFSIDFLLDRCTRGVTEDELKHIKKEALILADRFIKRIGKEQAYFDKATIYRMFNDSEKERKILLECLNTLKVTPKCSLRLADMEFGNGNFQMAIQYIERCCNTFRPQPGVSLSYSYLLLALGKTTILFQESNSKQALSNNEEIISDIYSDFFAAEENGLSGIYRTTADAVIKTIAAKSGIEYPYIDNNDKYDF